MILLFLEQALSAVVEPYDVLDVRTLLEYQAGYVEGAQNLDFYDPYFEKKIRALDPKKTYYVYCRSGARSEKALTLMNRVGIQKVTNLGSLQNTMKTLKKVCINCR